MGSQVESYASANVSAVAATALVRVAPASTPWHYALAKRALDVTVSLAVLAVMLPVVGAIALLIRLDSGGAIVFRQLRVAEGGRLFWFFKFRTMYVDARQ